MYIKDSYYLKNGFKNLEKINPEFELKNWCFKISKTEKEITNYCFWTNKSKHHTKYKVPIKNIVGTNHLRYCGKTWIEILGSLKKFNNHIWDKNTFLDLYKRNNITYSKYGDDYIIIGGGNHRSCIAKFFEFEYLECSVDEYSFDSELFNVFNQLKSRGLNPQESKHLRESIWYIKINDKKVSLFDFELVIPFINFYDNIEINIKNLLGKKINSIIGDNNNVTQYRIRNVEEFKTLKDDILKHKIKYGNTLMY